MVNSILVFSVFALLNSSVHAEEFSASTPHLQYQNSYEDARTQFLANTAALKKENPEVQTRELKIPTRTGENLTTDIVYVPPKSGKKDRLLILTSGMHGIEGFVGSALQNQFISENFWQLRDQNLGILIIHAINPYGFKHLRRVSENNVDLNRNFDTNSDLFKLKNEGYTKVSPLLNPADAAHSGWWDRLSFYVDCLHSILKYSMDSLRRAILRGQYENSAGIYFGGKNFEPQKELLEKEILTIAPNFSQVLLIDIHTGYGQRGHLHLFADRAPEINPQYLAKIFAGYTLDFGQEKDFYETTGGFVVFVGKLLKAKTQYAGTVFEFGTLDSQKTLGSLDSIYRMVRENQAFHFQANSESARGQINHLFQEMFYPSDLQWRASVAKQFQEALTRSLQNQKALN